jgi:hypothetical protein
LQRDSIVRGLGLNHPPKNCLTTLHRPRRKRAVCMSREQLRPSFYIATSKSVRADYSISRVDGTLVQEHAAPIAEANAGPPGKSVRGRARGTMSLSYSQWGKPLHISLPPECRATP